MIARSERVLDDDMPSLPNATVTCVSASVVARASGHMRDISLKKRSKSHYEARCLMVLDHAFVHTVYVLYGFRGLKRSVS